MSSIGLFARIALTGIIVPHLTRPDYWAKYGQTGLIVGAIQRTQEALRLGASALQHADAGSWPASSDEQLALLRATLPAVQLAAKETYKELFGTGALKRVKRACR